MIKTIKKLFYNPAWVVACRKIQNKDSVIPNKSQTPFTVLLPTSKEWYADSFCFEDKGRCYLFMEIMGRNGNKGTLGVSEYKNGKFSEVTEILREPFHLSYPNIFHYKDKFYMLPETNESKQVRLYESESFPYKWKLKKVLFEGARLVDSSLMKYSDNSFIVFSHDITDNAFKLRVFVFYLDELVLKEINVFPSASDERPGGNVISINGKCYRILQDCSVEYGKRLKVYRIDTCDLESGIYSEEFFDEITIDKLPMDKSKCFDRVHTYTRSGDYEAIDSQYERFYFAKPIKKLKEKLFLKS